MLTFLCGFSASFVSKNALQDKVLLHLCKSKDSSFHVVLEMVLPLLRNKGPHVIFSVAPWSNVPANTCSPPPSKIAAETCIYCMCYIVLLYEYFSWGIESSTAYHPVLFPAVREVVYTAQSNIIALSQPSC